MKVTDEMIDLALVTFMEGYDRSHAGLYKLEPISGKDLQRDMKAAVEAVFAMQEKPFCAGKDCDATKKNPTHSRECLFEHFMAYTGYDEEIRDELQQPYFDGMDAVQKVEPEDNQEGWIEYDGYRLLSEKEIDLICNDGNKYFGIIPTSWAHWHKVTHYRIKSNTVKPEKKTFKGFVLSKYYKNPESIDIITLIDLISGYLEKFI